MSATTIRNTITTDDAGVPPAPPEAHQRAGSHLPRRVVTMNGSRIEMILTVAGWINIRVTAAQ